MGCQTHDVDKHTAVGVLDKSVALLEAVAQGPLSLAGLVERCGLPRATTHRLASALCEHGLLALGPDGRYLLGVRLADWGRRAEGDPLLSRATPVLGRLQRQTGESAQLYRRRGPRRVCVAAADPRVGLRNTVPVGTVLPMTAGSAAHVLLAWDSGPATAALLAEAAFTARTLATVRRRGWAASVAEREPGVASVSAPVFGPDDQVVAAISVSGPVERLGRAPGPAYAPQVLGAAAALRG